MRLLSVTLLLALLAFSGFAAEEREGKGGNDAKKGAGKGAKEAKKAAASTGGASKKEAPAPAVKEGTPEKKAGVKVENGHAPAAAPAPASSNPILAGFKKVLEEVEKAGNLGFGLLLIFFFCVVCLSLPTTPIEMSAGLMYGPFWGFIAGLTGKTVGSWIAFNIARTLGKKYGWKIPAALEPRLGALKSQPLVTMIGIRVAPLPLGLKNYGLALCGVPMFQYVVASIIVNAPFSVMWASIGAACANLDAALNFDTSKVSIVGAIPDAAKPFLASAGLVIVGYAITRFVVSSRKQEKKTA